MNIPLNAVCQSHKSLLLDRSSDHHYENIVFVTSILGGAWCLCFRLSLLLFI